MIASAATVTTHHYQQNPGTEPSPFDHFPESKDVINRFKNGNLADSMIELPRDFIVPNLLLGLLKSIAIHDDVSTVTLLECMPSATYCNLHLVLVPIVLIIIVNNSQFIEIRG